MSEAKTVQGELDLGLAVHAAEGFDDLREKEYTAERLLVSHPDRYDIARRLFFEYGLTKRSVCEIVKVGSRTLNALIEREISTRGGEILREKSKSKRSMIKFLLTESIGEMVESESVMASYSLKEKMALLKEFDSISRRLDEPINANKSSDNGSEGDVIDADYLAVSDGLDEKKISARVRMVEGASDVPFEGGSEVQDVE